MDIWQTVLHNEWRMCDDSDYARRLHEGCGPFSFPTSAKRPPIHKVEQALYTACEVKRGAKPVWQKRLQRLEEAKRKDTPIDELIVQIEDHHWLARFIARHVLVHRGGRALVELQLLRYDASPDLKNVIDHLVYSICAETTERIGPSLDTWLCPMCLVRCTEHWIEKKWQVDWKYYGCRHCRRSHDLLKATGPIVVRLEKGWYDFYLQEGDKVTGNWFGYTPILFDFDAVEIVKVNDEEVEHFAMCVGNDTEPSRRNRYKNMVCTVDPACNLSPNTMRILESIFGQVS